MQLLQVVGQTLTQCHIKPYVFMDLVLTQISILINATSKVTQVVKSCSRSQTAGSLPISPLHDDTQHGLNIYCFSPDEIKTRRRNNSINHNITEEVQSMK